MQIYPLPLLLPELDLIPSLSEVCTNAKDDFRAYVDRGWYRETAEAGFYIYRIEDKGRQHTGILALNDVADYKNGHIKKHEKTLAAREAEYHLLLRDWQAVIKPVLMTYPAQPVVSDWMAEYTRNHNPDFTAEFGKDHEQHFLWAVTGAEDIRTLQQLFATVIPDVYIADGHHRTSTIANFSDRPEIVAEKLDFSRIFCAFFADDQLDILGYHRVLSVETPDGAVGLIAQLETHFHLKKLEAPRLPAHKRELVVIAGDAVWSLDLSATAEEASHVLDATLLNDLILSNLAGIEDPRKDKRIMYSEGAKGITGVKTIIADAPASRVGFLLFPVAFSDLFYISDQGESLPPKSTWFEPRIKSGLTVQSLVVK
jgi:uncharacterized protein (DUF1015 family)